MASSVCPKCLQKGRHLAASSENSAVDYYRCDGCGHVWSINKQGGAAKDVTVNKDRADRAS